MNLPLRIQHDETQSAIPNPQSAIGCSATTQDGSPCRARPVDGAAFCPFHHPDRAEAVAAGRRQGGSAAHRRVRRLPAVLDHLHVAEMLSELFVASMNDPEGLDLRRVHALTSLSRVLLRAVGAPRRGFLLHADRGETPRRLPHHTRLYPAPDPELQALLALADQDTSAPEGDASPSPAPTAAPPEALLLAPDSTLLAPGTKEAAVADRLRSEDGLTGAELSAAWMNRKEQLSWEQFAEIYLQPQTSGAVPPTPDGSGPSRAELEQALPQRQQQEAGQRRQAVQQAEEQAEEQAENRRPTGSPALKREIEENGAAHLSSGPAAGALSPDDETTANSWPAERSVAGPAVGDVAQVRAAGVPEGQPMLAQAFMPGKREPVQPGPGAPGAWTAESSPGFPSTDRDEEEAPLPPSPRGEHLPRSLAAINPGTGIHDTWPPKLPRFPW